MYPQAAEGQWAFQLEQSAASTSAPVHFDSVQHLLSSSSSSSSSYSASSIDRSTDPSCDAV
jgi:hypothetical protein